MWRPRRVSKQRELITVSAEVLPINNSSARPGPLSMAHIHTRCQAEGVTWGKLSGGQHSVTRAGAGVTDPLGRLRAAALGAARLQWQFRGRAGRPRLGPCARSPSEDAPCISLPLALQEPSAASLGIPARAVGRGRRSEGNASLPDRHRPLLASCAQRCWPGRGIPRSGLPSPLGYRSDTKCSQMARLPWRRGFRPRHHFTGLGPEHGAHRRLSRAAGQASSPFPEGKDEARRGTKKRR